MNLQNVNKGIFKSQRFAVLLPLIVIIEISRAFYFTEVAYIITRAALLLFLIPGFYILKENKIFRVFAFLVIIFSLWALLTTFWSAEPLTTLPRAIYFAFVVLGSVSAALVFDKLNPRNVFSYLLPANIFVVALSVYSLIFKSPMDAWTGGCGIGFKGFAPHQNTLGMMLLFTIPSVLLLLILTAKELYNKGKSTGNKSDSKMILSAASYLILFLLNSYILIISHSRASILSLIVIALVFLFLTVSWKYSLSLVLVAVFFVQAVLFLSPDLKEIVKEYVYKTENTLGDRRVWFLNNTINAARHGGLIGLGYGISDPQFKTDDIKVSEDQRYYREKIVGVLALVEEVGVVGLGIYLAFIGYVLVSLMKAKSKKDSANSEDNKSRRLEDSFSFAVLIGLCFHAQIEAWWQGAGAWQFFFFFLIIGSAIVCSSYQGYNLSSK